MRLRNLWAACTGAAAAIIVYIIVMGGAIWAITCVMEGGTVPPGCPCE